ncbi:unnamed protein product [Paramecium octaurelia]|uniref:Uncharacterized protein n=1 Tax=Paramecium octaurelia TaxID=43137 RepID=A0A8S1UHY9_PAROT|nr:unnamed protein product [Paramecium octaurelia]
MIQQLEELFSETPQYNKLYWILGQYNNTYVIGPNGVGKTTAVHFCLDKLKIPYRRINMMQCLTKQSLLQAIVNEISELWNQELTKISKFSELIIRLNSIISTSNQKNRRAYIIIDAPQYPQIEFIYLQKLFALSEIKSKTCSVNFIFICNQLPNIIEMPLGITMIFQSFDEELQIRIIYAHIMYRAIMLEDYQVQKQDNVRAFAGQVAKDVFVTFSIITTNLNNLIQIAVGLFENFIYQCVNLTNEEQLQIRQQYLIARKLLFENPFLQINSKEFKDLIEEVESQKNPQQKSIQESKKQQAETKTAIQTLEIQKIKLPKLPSLILLSSYYASRNPEKTDGTIFRDLKKNKRQSKVKEQLKVKQKVSLYRLIAITQSLMSINENKEFSIEKQQFNQSVQFYQQIQLLSDQGFIKVHHKKDDILNKIKLECQITEKQAFDLAAELNIQFNEFLSAF